MDKYRIDPELNDVLPDLSDEDYKALEQSLLTDGFKGAPIMVWGDIIVDGHNRYEICQRHNIQYEVKSIEFESKKEAIVWMARQQLGRRNLTPMQRIKIVENYRPFYTNKAKENKSSNGGDKKSELKNSATPIPKSKKIDVRAELAKDANVSTDTYSKGMKILNSGNEELISQTMNGEKSINKAYNELKGVQKSKDSSISSMKSELQNLKDTRRKEVAQNLKEIRENMEDVTECPEYEEAKQEQLNVEIQIESLEESIKSAESDVNEKVLLQIRNRYTDYLSAFQQDIQWLLEKDFIKNEEEVTGKIHSDLQNCFEKFKGMSDLMENVHLDEFDDNIIIVGK